MAKSISIKTRVTNLGLWARSNWKYVAMILCVLFIVRSCNENVELGKKITDINKVSAFEKQKLEGTVKYWKDKNGETHAKLESTIIDMLEGNAYIDSIADQLDIKTKQIQSISQTRIETRIEERLRVDTLKTDTCFDKNGQTLVIVKDRSFSWNDPWTSINGRIGDSGDSVSVQSTDTLTAVDYWQRSKVLGLRIGKVKGFVDYTNSNPHNTVTGGKKLIINPPKQRWTVGAGVSYGVPVYPKITLVPSLTIGITLSKTIIRF